MEMTLRQDKGCKLVRMALPLLVAGTLFAARDAQAGDFMDTRISFFFQDDDFLHGAGETLPSSPDAGFGVRKGRVFFFENHNKKDRGDETMTHLVSYKSMPGFIPNLTTEAALVIKMYLDAIYEGNYTAQKGGFADDGTYINMRYDLGDGGKDRLDLTLFPFSTERFQLGYSYRMAWGGSNIFGAARKGPAPGLKLTYTHGESYVFAGAKTATILQFAPYDEPDVNDELDTFYAGLAGAGYALSPELLLEINGGLFQRGTNPNNPVRGEPVNAWGVSVQGTYHLGMPVTRSADFALYRNDPTKLPGTRAAGTEKPFGLYVATEFTALNHALEDPENYGATEYQTAIAADVNVLVQKAGLLVHADAVYRGLPFVLFNVPSFVPYQAFGKDLETSPEFWASLGAEYALPNSHLTPGLSVGLQLPASVKAVPTLGSNAPTSESGARTVVVRGEGDMSILPPGEEATPIFATKANLRWDLSEMLSIIGEVYLSVDNNRTLLEDDVTGISTASVPERKFVDPLLLGGSLIAQARF